MMPDWLQLVKNAEQIRHAEEVEARQKALLARGGLSKEEYEAALNALTLQNPKNNSYRHKLQNRSSCTFRWCNRTKSITLGSYITPATRLFRLSNPTL